MLHPDFGSNPDYGIPYVVVPGNQPRVPIGFDQYGDESDPGPYPVPPARADRGRLATTTCSSSSSPISPAGRARSTSSTRRSTKTGRRTAGPPGRARSSTSRCRCRSAPRAGRPPTRPGCRSSPGLVRYEEVASGFIGHAIRVTFSSTQNGYVFPATHRASSSSNCNRPPMGLRLRLRADWFDSPRAGFSGRRGGDPRGAAPLRDDRRRQRLELVHQRLDRPALGRREPQPAQGRARDGVRGRRHGRADQARGCALRGLSGGL